MASLFQKVSSGALWVGLGSGIQVILQLLLLVVLSRLLNPSEFGQVTAALTVVSFSTIFSQLGVGPALVQSESVTESHIRTAWTLSLALGTLFCFCTYFFADAIQSFYKIDGLRELIKILAFVFPIAAFGAASESILQRNLKFRELMKARILSYFFGYGLLSLILAYAGFGAKSLAYGFLAQAIFFSSLVYSASPHSLRPSFDLRKVKSLARFGAGVTLAKVGNYVATQGDYIIVGKVLGVASLGVYSRSYQLLMLPTNLIGTVLDKVLFPTLSSMQGDKSKLQAVYQKGIALVALLTFPFLAFSIVFAPEVVRTVLGLQWEHVITPFQILVLVLFFRTAYKVNESLIKAAGFVFRLASVQWIYALAMVSFSLLGSIWGLNGVATGVSFAVLVNYWLTANLLGSVIPFSWHRKIKLILPGITAGLLVFTISIFVKLFATEHLPSFLLLLVGGLSSLSVLACLSYLFPRILLGDEGVWLAKRLKKH